MFLLQLTTVTAIPGTFQAGAVFYGVKSMDGNEAFTPTYYL